MKKGMVGSSYLDGIEKGVCDDGFFDILNVFDFPMESLEGDGIGNDWIAKFQSLGPIPWEILTGSPPFSRGNNDNGTLDMQPMSSMPCNETSKPNRLPKFVEKTSMTCISPGNDSSDGKESGGVFQAPSPTSVLGSSSSCSAEKRIFISPAISIPVGRRSKRSRTSTFNPWFMMSPISYSASKKIKRMERKKNLSQLSGTMETKETSFQRPTTPKCTHCQVSRTPQWRDGPMGRKTLCNACGVRYRSNRLFPEYRPAASPTFVPSVHSNSHRKVTEMRNKIISVCSYD